MSLACPGMLLKFFFIVKNDETLNIIDHNVYDLFVKQESSMR